MTIDMKERLRLLPAVHEVVKEYSTANTFEINITEITWAVRKALQKARDILSNNNIEQSVPKINKDREDFWNYPHEEFIQSFRGWLREEVGGMLQGTDLSLRRVINATGVVLHTNCGRAILAPEVADYVALQAKSYNNLELDTETGTRGSRYTHVETMLQELSGAEAALVVNNNAAAVLLVMNTLANQREVIVSRGELVEVGGSFRIPEVLKAGGSKLVEVGTTNKTWVKDYSQAINDNTALLLKVHTSNYRIEGFQHSVSLEELVDLGVKNSIPVVEDLGSGSFLDGIDLGIPKEPTIQETIKAGVSLVTFSGDKLLGGPQAGIILGKKNLIDKLKNNQLTRALRINKLSLAALIGTLRLYEKGEINRIPVWRMLTLNKSDLHKEAQNLKELVSNSSVLQAEVQEHFSCVGGGALPTANLPSYVCAIKPLTGSVIDLERFLLHGSIPILTRIVRDSIFLDPRTLLREDYQVIAARLMEWNTLDEWRDCKWMKKK